MNLRLSDFKACLYFSFRYNEAVRLPAGLSDLTTYDLHGLEDMIYPFVGIPLEMGRCVAYL